MVENETEIEGEGDGNEVEETDACDGLVYETRVFVDGGVFADFRASGIEGAFYEWFVNDELYVFDENDNRNNDDHSFLRLEFTENGSYDITVRTETPECAAGVSYTEIIEINEVVDAVVIEEIEEEETSACDGLVFESRVFVDGGVFADLTASGIEGGRYEWYIDGELYVFTEDEKRNNENQSFLRLEFTENDSYDIVVLTETVECPAPSRYSETIVIDQF